MGRICNNCGHLLEDEDVFCLNCGARATVPPAMREDSADDGSQMGIAKTPAFCPECGKRIKPYWSFCMNCGRHLTALPSATSAFVSVPSPAKTIVMTSMPEMHELRNKQNMNTAPSQGMTDAVTVSTRVVRVEDFDIPASAPPAFEDDYDLWDKTDAGGPYDDEPTALYEEDDGDDAPTMVYAEDCVSICVLTRVSTGEVLKLKLPTTIGRGNAAEVRVNGNPYIGRVHARLFDRDGMVYVKDEDSANHTYVNGSMLASGAESALETGDVLSLAKEEFIVDIR